MERDLEKILYTKNDIDEIVTALANRISADYSSDKNLNVNDSLIDGRNIVLIGVLKGSYMFLSDLSRRLSIPHTVDFMSVSSYQNTESSGEVKINADLKNSITGKHVIIVEDIIDTGLTLQNLVNVLKTRNPLSINLCCAFSKPAMRKIDMHVEYVGFTIDPPAFIVGYGLDYNEMFRNLSCVGIPSKDAIERYKTN
jgi:hypoxanthine phosphoribosyltransferase